MLQLLRHHSGRSSKVNFTSAITQPASRAHNLTNRALTYQSHLAVDPVIRIKTVSHLSSSSFSPLHPTSRTMAPSIDLKALVGNTQTPQDTAAIQSQLISILDPALNGSSPPAAESVASDIDALYKKDHNSDDKAEEFLYTFWTLYIDVVKQLSVDDPRLPLLASIAVSLRSRSSGTVKVWREATEVWKGEPLLASCMRDAWNFSPRYDGSDKDNATVSSWLTLNSFAARLLGAGAATWTNFAIWSLRSGLEEEEPSSQAARDSAVAVTYEWIAHAGKVLADQSRTGGKEELSKVDRNALAAGKLFGGEPGLNWERWTFWKQRLETFAGGEEVSDAGKAKAQKAVDEMKALEG